MEELWKDIDGFVGKYQISNMGRVRSLHWNKEIILKGGISKFGYRRVVLTNNNYRKYYAIHRLVALAFIPNPENKPEVNHKDENKLNNRVDNLEWVTCKENIQWGTSLEKRAFSQRKTQATKAVYQFDKSLNLINVFPSRNEAARVLGIQKSGIGHACNHSKGFPTYKGYIWRYEEDVRNREIATQKSETT